MHTVSRFGDYLALGLVGGFALLIAMTWGTEPREATLVESPVFAVRSPGVEAIDAENGGRQVFAFGTKCMWVAPEPPEAAIVEVKGRRWRVHRSCVKVTRSE